MRTIVTTALVAAIMVLSPSLALAYIGPGAGLSAIGSLLALLAAIGLALVGFIWYPIKRLLRRPPPKVQNPGE